MVKSKPTTETNGDNREIQVVRAGSLHNIETSMRFEAVLVSPVLAQHFLDKAHPKQRREKRAKVGAFVSDMEADRWILGPDPICVSVHGETVNGLNRCRAIVRSGKTVPMFICYDVPEECFPCLDCGSSRNANDAAKISGMVVPSRFHGIAKQMMTALKPRSIPYSIGYTLKLVEAYSQGIDYAVSNLHGAPSGISTASTQAVIARAWYTANRDRLKKFCEALVSGFCDNRKTDGAVILLRNWLLEAVANRKTGGAGTGYKWRAMAYARTEFALDAFLCGVCPKAIIEVSGEMFPLPDLE